MNRDLEKVAIQASLPILPPLSDCPPTTEDNEWKSGLTYSINADGNLLSGGVFDLQAVKEDKAVPHLDEVTNTSLLLPYPGASWEGVESTFIP